MGILDSKTRVMDVVMTPWGRSMLARGGLNVAYASFTDGQTYYDPSSISGSIDSAVDRIYLESPASLPQDMLAVVTDDSGNIIPTIVLASSSYASTLGSDGTIYSGSLAINGINPTFSSSFSSAIIDLTNTFQAAYKLNTIIGSRDPLDDTDSFVINPVTASFTINSSDNLGIISSIGTANSLFFDRRFSNSPQFKFLPPVVKNGDTDVNLGTFVNIKESNSYTYEDMKNEIFGTDQNPIKQRFDSNFQDTSLSNDIVMQMYEITVDGVTKLESFDYGEVTDLTDRARQNKRVIFFGKVQTDQYESATFLNLFTVVLD
jgi:hypothetical protein